MLISIVFNFILIIHYLRSALTLCIDIDYSDG